MKQIDRFIETLLTKKYYTVIDAMFLAMIFSTKGLWNLVVIALWVVYRKYYVTKILVKLKKNG